MEFKADVEKEVREILGWELDVRQAKSVPQAKDLTLGETAAIFTTAVLYTDMRGSSRFPEIHRRATVAKIFNGFLNGVVRIIRAHNGHVRSINGDSVLAFFDPKMDNPCYAAVCAALWIPAFVREVLVPEMRRRQYPTEVDIGVGVTYGPVFATKVGIRGDNNSHLIWPCTATNLAAKLGDAGEDPYNVIVSKEVYDRLTDDLRFSGQWPFRDWFWRQKSITFAGEWTTVYRTDKKGTW